MTVLKQQRKELGDVFFVYTKGKAEVQLLSVFYLYVF